MPLGPEIHPNRANSTAICAIIRAFPIKIHNFNIFLLFVVKTTYFVVKSYYIYLTTENKSDETNFY